jgi:hypothetical protein
MKKAGKARKAAKTQRAAKQRARHRRTKEMQREERRSRLAAARAALPVPRLPPASPQRLSSGPSAPAKAALEFCRQNDLNAYEVLATLVADCPAGAATWELSNGAVTHAVDAVTRHELIVRLSNALFKSVDKKAEPSDQPQEPTIVEDEPLECL